MVSFVFLSKLGDINQMQIYATTSELLALIGILPVVFFRGTTLYFARENFSRQKEAIHVTSLLISGGLLGLVISVFLLIVSPFIAMHLYNVDTRMNTSWWDAFFWFLIPVYVLELCSSVIRGYLQHLSRFKAVAIVDLLASWLVFLPIFGAGLYFKSYLVFYHSYLVSGMILFIVLLVLSSKDLYPNLLGPKGHESEVPV
jgi:Na+-driven multidrug efflux pump